MTSASRRRVQFTGPGEVEVVTEPVPDPAPDEVVVQTECSAVSPGTERLVYEGHVPETLAADTTIEALEDDDFSYPISYGYACVGTVETAGSNVDAEWEGRTVFSFQPHVSRFVTSPSALVRVPPAVSAVDAALIPSVETAVNFVMDGRPMVGEQVVVLGQGVVGLLTTQLLSRHPLRGLWTVEPSPHRRAVSESLGGTAVASSSDLELGTGHDASGPDASRADLVFELTGKPSVLNDAVQRTAFSGRIVVGSWYGTKSAPIDLGRHFHRSRMEIISSQVSTIDPSLRGRWTKDRRMSVVLDLLPTLTPSDLVSQTFSLDDAPAAYEQLSTDPSMLQPVFQHN
ncbi:zinc-dependent alcohol dehydrogenase [Salinibacter ruber]|uniref:zinc-dependent alcohol dehydrogenase n=1 Tax=Salinibacter ruber TaxID=146919 RepID=UPI0021675F6F|nr:oxidoreductase [Salinibacter ruber]MCS3756671.1 2-desacetyl-2-hydroxyethyl bacteriochlorophyllide A dehydrogenase [Salinibacter ruber]MCS3953779.1 2-desacetyl-2-hydroxyethyl bacteriochlorophyllide A dehydrogenase [Salinibacter ruber]MCS4087256.1 2-desacetyl-2-hydroxyethyl bacteriochlorophyllide A dehydrogenase [Salinibacter ruber]